MADLIDRIQGTAPRPKLPIHQFAATLGEYCRGVMTAAEITTSFDFQGLEQVDFMALLVGIDSKGNLDKKLQFVLEIGDVCYLAEQPNLGMYATKTAIRARLVI